MDAIDPLKFSDLIEKYFGDPFGKIIVRISVLCGFIGILLFGITWLIKLLETIWEIIALIFGVAKGGITLDNIEIVVIFLVAILTFFIVFSSVMAWLFWSSFRRRVVPQSAIDRLADLRSDGISVLNQQPRTGEEFAQWRESWKTWVSSVASELRANFTKAEALSFERLGLLRATTSYAMAFDADHSHCLLQLDKQLTILENLISRHQERR
jgi:hypothetical protein